MLTLIRYAYGVSRISTVVAFGLAVLTAGLGVLMTFLVGRVVGAVPGVVADRPDAMSTTAFGWLLAALLVVFVVSSTLPTFSEPAQIAMAAGVRRDVTVGITEPLLRPARMNHLEDKEIHDQQERAKGKSGFQVSVGLESLPDLVSSRLTLIGSAVLVGQLFSWWIAAALTAVTLFMEWFRGHSLSTELDSWWGNTEGHRRAEYVFDLGMKNAPKELRVFGLGGWLVRRHAQHWLEAWGPIWAARRRALWINIAVSSLHLGAHGVAIVLVGRAALAGDVALTQVATVVPAILAVAMSYNGYAAIQAKRALAAHQAMRELPVLIDNRHPEVPGTATEHRVEHMPRHTVRFENVSFRYPDTDTDILDGLDLELRAGEALALVGVNGAGKSTLVKLLAGVYSPTRGRITVDGIDLRELDLARWERQVATIVQDFVRFPLSATDNVILGAAEHAADEQALATVVAQAGIRELVDGLPGGWDTILDKTYEGGVDLSGGEWQRVALARALFAVRAGAGVLVLDEPAAALDVRAEAELIERYLDLTSGVSSLIISHRFSVVRDAHRICVLEGGRIVESGSHDALIEAGGKYAGMFRLQAERYVSGTSEVSGSPQDSGAPQDFGIPERSGVPDG